jgi:hypothetical protein
MYIILLRRPYFYSKYQVALISYSISPDTGDGGLRIGPPIAADRSLARRQPNFRDQDQLSSFFSSQHQRDGRPETAVSMAHAIQNYAAKSNTRDATTRELCAGFKTPAEVMSPIRDLAPPSRKCYHTALWQGPRASRTLARWGISSRECAPFQADTSESTS